MKTPIVVLFVGALSACAAPMAKPQEPQILQRTQLVYPEAPLDKLMCPPEPAIGTPTTDVQLAKWADALREAGAACRANLDYVREWIGSWPK